jgi:hypothetical protein
MSMMKADNSQGNILSKKTSTGQGLQIGPHSEQPMNVQGSIRFDLDPDSKANDESDEQVSKPASHRTSTETRTQIDPR